MPGDQTPEEDYPRGWPKKGRAGVARFLSRFDDDETRRTLLRSLEELAGGRPGSASDAAKLVDRIEQLIPLATQLEANWPASGSVVRCDVPLDRVTRLLGCEVDLAALEPADRFCTLVEASRLKGRGDLEHFVARRVAERAAMRDRERLELERAVVGQLLDDAPDPVPLARLHDEKLAPGFAAALAAHPPCGLVPVAVAREKAIGVAALARVGRQLGAVRKVFPNSARHVPFVTVAAHLGLDPATLAVVAGRPHQETMGHEAIDELSTAATLPGWPERVAAAVAVIEERQRSVERVRDARRALGLEPSDKTTCTTAEAAVALGISVESVRAAISRGDLPAHSVRAMTDYGRRDFWRVDLAGIAEVLGAGEPVWLRRARQAHARVVTRTEITTGHLEARFARLLRSSPPAVTEVFLGPTNSGKTYRAIERLASRGAGVYAAPLRMLAWEVRDTLARLVGEENVGLVTGEERINEHAPILCCTAEMAPLHAPLLVLDEVQWAADPQRGFAWTRLLAGAEVDELYVTGEVGAAPLVRAVLGDDVPITWCDRLTPLVLGSPVSLEDVPPRSCVVAFSRKAVLHLAGRLEQAGRRVSVLYGGLPPEVRRLQIATFLRGGADVVVATDLIGHGVNLPIDSVVLAETHKFDGEMRRPLVAWEIAQIAGRAGRYGLSDRGVVTTLAGEPGFAPDRLDVHAALERPAATVDGHPACRIVRKGFVGPRLDDLEVESSKELSGALRLWGEVADAALGAVAWASVASVEPLRERLERIGRALVAALELDDAWALARSPLDATDENDVELLVALASHLAGRRSDALERLVPVAAPRHRSAEQLERLARRLVGLRWATLCFAGRLGVDHAAVTKVLDEVARLLNAQLQRSVADGVAHCQTCGALCAPWFTECDPCHQRGRARYHDWDDEYDDWDDEEDEDDEEDGTRGYGGALSRAARGARHVAEVARRDELTRAIDALATSDPLLARPHSFPRPTWLELIPSLQALPDPERALRRAKLVVAQRAGRAVDTTTIVRDAGSLRDDDPAVTAALTGVPVGVPTS